MKYTKGRTDRHISLSRQMSRKGWTQHQKYNHKQLDNRLFKIQIVNTNNFVHLHTYEKMFEQY